MSHACHRFWTCDETLTFCSLLTRCTIPCACHAKRALKVQKWSQRGVFCTFWLGNVLRATTACTFSTSQLPEVVRESCVLYMFTSKCASRHNGVHFFDIATSKRGPTLTCFVHVHFEMCFAPQRRALFRHLNFQKWSENRVLCTFSLGNVLRATTAYTFSTSQLPNVVRHWGALYMFTSKCASRHNGVHFFDMQLPKAVRDPGVLCILTCKCASRHNACNFSSLIWPAGSAPAALASLLFDPPDPQIMEKHSVSRLSYLFSHLHLLSSYSFSSTLLSSNLSLLSASSLLCFSSVHIVGSLTLNFLRLAQKHFDNWW